MSEPPFDGSEPCPACPAAVRDLFATAHNAARAYKSSGEAGDWERVHRKMVELVQAVEAFQSVIDEHFADSMHSRGSVR